ncbi:MAG: hypothetical protein K0M49_20570 [Arenimonas sp.]|nr:hypothetical protein [Rhizobium sp.]MBW8448025.1 hypothetical protein [Arenimonas sp.]
MSTNPQLGLFSSSDKDDEASTSDAAPSSSASSEVAVNVENLDAANSAKPVTPVPSERRRVRNVSVGGMPQAEERYLSVQDVARRYAISIQTVWRHTKHNPDFPKPIKILNGSTRWRMSDILAYEVRRQEVGR